MTNELRSRLENDIRSSLQESLNQLADETNPNGGTVLDQFVDAYSEVCDNNEDAKGLTLGIGVRLVPKSDQIAIAVTAKWSSITKHGLERGTSLDGSPDLFNQPQEGGEELGEPAEEV